MLLAAAVGHDEVGGAESNTESGVKPDSSATASVNGLNAEPGWRWPSVARLNGYWAKSSLPLTIGPPTIARTSPVLLSIATSEAVGRPCPVGSSSEIACSAAACSLRSIVVRIFRPP